MTIRDFLRIALRFSLFAHRQQALRFTEFQFLAGKRGSYWMMSILQTLPLMEKGSRSCGGNQENPLCLQRT